MNPQRYNLNFPGRSSGQLPRMVGRLGESFQRGRKVDTRCAQLSNVESFLGAVESNLAGVAQKLKKMRATLQRLKSRWDLLDSTRIKFKINLDFFDSLIKSNMPKGSAGFAVCLKPPYYQFFSCHFF